MSRAAIPFLVGGMLVTGASNSIFTKYQDKQCVRQCDSSHPVYFEQPVWQTLTMFAGECLCLIAFYLIRYRSLYIPASFLERASSHSEAIKAKFASSSSSKPYRRLPTSDAPDDSGVVFSESAIDSNFNTMGNSAIQLAPGSRVPGVVNATSALVRVREEEGVGRSVFGAHGATTGPLPVAIDQELVAEVDEDEYDEDEYEGEKMAGLKTCLFWFPALFDICGTTLMNVGLLFTPVSVYQMTRGALVLWVGLLSTIFLRRRLGAVKWLALTLVMTGVAVVGLSAPITKWMNGDKVPADGEEGGDDVGQAMMGVLLILFAQVFTASQFVVEEKIMSRYSVEPLHAVGLEGFFGFITTLALMPILYFALGASEKGKGGYFDIPDGWNQIMTNATVAWTSVAIMFSIAFFNFFGLAVTRTISATARSTIDTSRTVIIWVISLLLGWEYFQGLQVIGFAVLVYGTFVFNGLARLPFISNADSEDVEGEVKLKDTPDIVVSEEREAREDSPLLEAQRRRQ